MRDVALHNSTDFHPTSGALSRKIRAVPRSKTPLAVLGLVFIAGFLMHRAWFSNGVLTYGDWGYLSHDTMRAYLHAPSAWSTQLNLGQDNPSLYAAPYEIGWGILGFFHVSYALAERILFFWPVAILPFLTMFYLAGRFIRSRIGRIGAAVLFGANTYALILSNNQLTVAMAYALTPLTLGLAISSFEDDNAGARRAVLAGVCFAIMSIFDPRIALLAALLVVTFAAALFVRHPKRWITLLNRTSLFLLVSAGLSAYWIVPLLISPSSRSVVSTLPNQPWISWTDLAHAAALDHPFWTGKASAIFRIQPVVFPLIALPVIVLPAALLRLRTQLRPAFFVLVLAVGIFLTKGENPPFGWIYSWGFAHVPGMRLFRDPSKFFLFIGLGYAVLLGIFVEDLVARIREAVHRRRRSSLVISIVAGIAALTALVLPTVPAFAGNLGGTYRPVEVPTAAKSLETILSSDQTYGRVLWIPSEPRFSYANPLHPGVNALDLVDLLSGSNTPAGQSTAQPPAQPLAPVFQPGLSTLLQRLSVRYVVISSEPGLDSWPGATTEQRRGEIRRTIEQVGSSLTSQPVLDTPTYVAFRLPSTLPYASLGPVGVYSGRGYPSQMLPSSANQQPLAFERDLPELTLPSDGQVVTQLDAEEAMLQPGKLDFSILIPERGSYRILPSSDTAGTLRFVVLESHNRVLTEAQRLTSSGTVITFPRAGRYTLILSGTGIGASVLPNGSFDQGPWRPVGDAAAISTEPLSSLGLSSEAVVSPGSTGKALRLSARLHLAGVCQTVSNFQPGSSYLVRFRWLMQGGTGVAYAFWWGNSVGGPRYTLPPKTGWQAFVGKIEPPAGATDMALCFYAGPGSKRMSTSALFDDASVSSLRDIPDWLTLQRLTDASAPIPARVSRQSPSSVMLDFAGSPPAGPHLIELSEAFRTGWDGDFVVEASGVPRRLSTKHLKSVEGLNLWYIDIPPGTTRLSAVIRYSPQRAVWAGVLLSMFTFIGILLFHLVRWRKTAFSRRT